MYSLVVSARDVFVYSLHTVSFIDEDAGISFQYAVEYQENLSVARKKPVEQLRRVYSNSIYARQEPFWVGHHRA